MLTLVLSTVLAHQAITPLEPGKDALRAVDVSSSARTITFDAEAIDRLGVRGLDARLMRLVPGAQVVGGRLYLGGSDDIAVMLDGVVIHEGPVMVR